MTGPQFHSAAVAELIKQPDEPGRHALDHVQSTDVSLRDLFVKWYADRLYYCHAWRCWLVWDGRRWARDESGQIYRFVIDMSKRLYDAAFSHPATRKNAGGCPISRSNTKTTDASRRLYRSRAVTKA